MLELLYISTRTITLNSGQTPACLVYLQAWDACLLLNYSTLDKVFRDGTQLNLGIPIGTWLMGGRQGGQHFWIAPNDANPVYGYGADEITGQPHFDEILNPDWLIPLGTYRSGDFIDDRLGWFFHNSGAGEVQQYRLADGQLMQTFIIPDGPLYDFLVSAGGGRLLACHKSTGKVALLDYQQGAVLWQSVVRPFWCATYDLRHDLIITLESDLKIRLYLPTPVPAVLSAPAFMPAAPEVHRLHGYPVQTRLTGDSGEPCPGYWIEWSLLGDPAKGYLSRPRSKTDANGYADNFYFGPAASGDLGVETVRAQVII